MKFVGLILSLILSSTTRAEGPFNESLQPGGGMKVTMYPAADYNAAALMWYSSAEQAQGEDIHAPAPLRYVQLYKSLRLNSAGVLIDIANDEVVPDKASPRDKFVTANRFIEAAATAYSDLLDIRDKLDGDDLERRFFQPLRAALENLSLVVTTGPAFVPTTEPRVFLCTDHHGTLEIGPMTMLAFEVLALQASIDEEVAENALNALAFKYGQIRSRENTTR